jgi:hypothetical protein
VNGIVSSKLMFYDFFYIFNLATYYLFLFLGGRMYGTLSKFLEYSRMLKKSINIKSIFNCLSFNQIIRKGNKQIAEQVKKLNFENQILEVHHNLHKFCE